MKTEPEESSNLEKAFSLANKIPPPLSLPTSSLCFQEFFILRGLKPVHANICTLKAWFYNFEDFRDQYGMWSLSTCTLDLPALGQPAVPFLWSTDTNRICLAPQFGWAHFEVFVQVSCSSVWLLFHSSSVTSLDSSFLPFLFLCVITTSQGGECTHFVFLHYDFHSSTRQKHKYMRQHLSKKYPRQWAEQFFHVNLYTMAVHCLDTKMSLAGGDSLRASLGFKTLI